MATSTPRWSSGRLPQARSGRCGWTSTRPSYPTLSGSVTLRPAGRRGRLHRTVDGTACRTAQSGPAHRADRRPPHRVGGVGSQRRLRRGQPDPRPRERKDALAQRDRHARAPWAWRTSTACRPRSNGWASTSNGNAAGCSSVATEPHQVTWLQESAAEGDGQFLDAGRGARRGRTRRRTSPGLFEPDTCAIVHPAKLALELARACTEAGVQHLRAHQRDVAGLRRRGDSRRRRAAASVTAKQVVLATNVFPQPAAAQPVPHRAGLRLRAGHRTADRRPAATASDGGNRQGIGDSANQFHYYR